MFLRGNNGKFPRLIASLQNFFLLKSRQPPIFGLKYFLQEPYSNEIRSHQMLVTHIFDHELYGRADGLNVRLNPQRT